MPSFLMPLQQFLALNKKKIEQAFLVVELFVVVFLLVSSFQFFRLELPYSTLYSIGRRLGQVSVVLYLITLTPGIMQRLKILTPVAAMIMLFRRHFGVLTFLMVVTHSTFIVWLPQLATRQFVWPMGFALMGSLALACFLPMWLTSNDYSKELLGVWWKRLHRITYLALFFVYLHVALQSSTWRWPVLIFLGLEVISWAVAWWRLLTTRTPAVASTPPPTPPAPVQTPPVVK
ncbi:MAG TPA: ferric reductase-like transmembrane domain-containing protein [Patescibacteria group bacterium]